MENEVDDKVLLKLLDIIKEKPKCCFSLALDPLGMDAIQAKELAQQLDMTEGDVASSMRRLIKKEYLKYMDIDGHIAHSYVFLTDSAKTYAILRECEVAIKKQKQMTTNAIQHLSISINKQLELAEKEAKSAAQSAKKAQWLTIIEIIVAVLATIVNILIAIFLK